MAKTVVLIRCTTADARTIEQYKLLKRSMPGLEVLAVPDMSNGIDDGVLNGFVQSGMNFLPITEEFLVSAGLEKAGNRTGWVCGDYVFSRALEAEWDFAWIVEPDLYFINGSEKIISRLQNQSHDLIGTFIWPAHPKWVWHDPLDALDLGMKVYAMSFPFLRMSRTLVGDVLKARQKIATIRTESQKVPNDESVVASVAHSSDYAILDLSKLMPDTFKYWSTVTRHNIKDITAQETEERIVHSGQSEENFHQYINSQLDIALTGSVQARDRVLRSLESSSKETVVRVLSEVIDKFGQPNR